MNHFSNNIINKRTIKLKIEKKIIDETHKNYPLE